MTLLTASARRRHTSAIPSSAPYNVPEHLFIPTYEGSNEPIHLDVIDFGTTPWNGWRFWMAFTPYPNFVDDYENPSIVVSQDGITWQVPDGLTNPVYFHTGSWYNSDTDLAYDPATDELVLVFRDYKTHMVARSSDGVTWPAAPTPNGIAGSNDLSPSLLRLADGTWRLWVMNATYSAPTPEGPWTIVAGIALDPPIWHLNVAHAPGGGFHMLYHSSSLGACYAASSATGGAGASWTVNPTPLLVSGTESWSMTNLYRPALTLHEDGDRYRVWYSGVSPAPTGTKAIWRTGYTEIPLSEWPAIP